MIRYPRFLLWLGLVLFPLEIAAAIFLEWMNWSLVHVTISPDGTRNEFPPGWFLVILILLSFSLMLVSVFVGIWRWSKLAGVVFVLLVVTAFSLPLFVPRRHGLAPESSALSQLRTINTAEVTYLSSSAKYGSIEDLLAAGLLDPKFDSRKPIAGYRIDFMSGGWLTATPISRVPGKYAYCTDSEGNIHYSTTPEFAPPNEAGNLVKPDVASDVQGIMTALKAIDAAQKKYVKLTYGTIPDLISAGLLDDRFTRPVAGYTFNVVASGDDYTATATPVSTNTGRYGYYSTPDAVVRYAPTSSATCNPCFPQGQSGQPVQ